MTHDPKFWNNYMDQNFVKINNKIRSYFPNDIDLAEEAISFTLERISAKLKKKFHIKKSLLQVCGQPGKNYFLKNNFQNARIFYGWIIITYPKNSNLITI